MPERLSKNQTFHQAARAAMLAGAVALCAVCLPAEAGWNRGSVGTIVYSVFVPDNYSAAVKYPLIMYLHGAGQRGADYGNINMPDMLTLSSPANQQQYPCIVYAPQCPTNAQWVNVPAWNVCIYSIDTTPESNALKSALMGFDTVLAKYSIDTNRMILSGGSMGGYATWDILGRHPDNRFAAAVPIAGGGDTSKVAAFATRLPVWAFHGINDAVVPIWGDRLLMQAMARAGGSPPSKLTEFTTSQINQNGYIHTNDHIYCMPFPIEPDLMAWIFSQTRKSTACISNKQALKVASVQPEIRKRMSLLPVAGFRILLSDNRGRPYEAFDIRGRMIEFPLKSK